MAMGAGSDILCETANLRRCSAMIRGEIERPACLRSLRFFHGNLPGPETLHLSVVIAKQKRALVIQTTDHAVVAAAAFEQSDGSATQQIVTMPQVGERLE